MKKRIFLPFACTTLLASGLIAMAMGPTTSTAATVDEDPDAPETEPVDGDIGPFVDPIPGEYILVDGYVETHTHNLARYGYGGRYVHGESNAAATDLETDLAACDGDDHALSWIPGTWLAGLGFDPLTRLVGTEYDRIEHMLRVHGFDEDEDESFADWPLWSTVSHQQIHPSWIKELFETGTSDPLEPATLNQNLKIFVLSAVNFRPLCELLLEDNGDIDPETGAPFVCDDDDNLERQLELAWGMSNRGRDGAVNSGGFDWFQIVRTPSELRQTIADGRLAVVLHLEATELMDSGALDPELTYAAIERNFWHYYDLGVRSFQPVHELDNQFGGTAAFKETALLRAAAMLVDWANLDNPRLSSLLFIAAEAAGAKIGGLARAEVREIMRRYRIEKDDEERNLRGLSRKGHYLSRIAMCEGMLVDAAHMGERTFWGLHSASVNAYSGDGNHDRYEAAYPMFHSHTRFRSMQIPGTETEYNTSDSQITAIRRTGGMIGMRTGPTPVVDGDSPVGNGCQGTTMTWAQSYAYGRDMSVPMGISSDMPGAVQQLRPRYADEDSKWGASHDGESVSVGPNDEWPCGSKIEGESPSDFEARRGGEQSAQSDADRLGTDYDLIGFARYDLMDDIMMDAEQLGQSVEIVKNQSAQAFVAMWSRAHDVNTDERNPKMEELCTYTGVDLNGDGELESWEIVRDRTIESDDEMRTYLTQENLQARFDRGEEPDLDFVNRLKEEPWRASKSDQADYPAPPPIPPLDPGMSALCEEGDVCAWEHPSGEAFPPAWLLELADDPFGAADDIESVEPWQQDYMDELELAPGLQQPPE